MVDFLNKHTFCGPCGRPVIPGVYYECKKKQGPFTPELTNEFWCAWCQTTATPIGGYKQTKCSNCKHELHGVIANPGESVMHDPYATKLREDRSHKENINHNSNGKSYYAPQSRPSNFWNGRSATGTNYSSPYYQSTETYVQRYDNPIRNSSTYDSGNAWHNQSAYVYDITH
jgi:hypothetical protein